MADTIISQPGYFHPKYPTGVALELRGLSTDEKKTDGIPNGSAFLEMDTGVVYFWDAENSQWRTF